MNVGPGNDPAVSVPVARQVKQWFFGPSTTLAKCLAWGGAALVLLFLIGALAGDKEEQSGQSSAPSRSVNGAAPVQSKATPAAAKPVFALPEPVRLNIPAQDAQLGPNLTPVSSAIKSEVTKAFGAPAGNLVDVYVYPIGTSKASMLVLDADMTRSPPGASQPSQSQQFERFLRTLIAMPEVKTANITRFTYVSRAKDSRGAATVTTITMPFSALDTLSKGGQLSAQAQKDLAKDILVQTKPAGGR